MWATGSTPVRHVSIPDGYQGGGYYGGYQGGGYYDGYQGGGNCYDYQGGEQLRRIPGPRQLQRLSGRQQLLRLSRRQQLLGYQGGGNCYGDGGCYGSKYRRVERSNLRGAARRHNAPHRRAPGNLRVRPHPRQSADPESKPDLCGTGPLSSGVQRATQLLPRTGTNWGYQPWGAKYGHFDHKYAANLYTVQAGEKLKDIAKKFDTTQEDLLDLNPSLKGKPGNIYRGLVLVLW